MNPFRHLKKRRQGWYARLSVPISLQSALGRRDWSKALAPATFRKLIGASTRCSLTCSARYIGRRSRRVSHRRSAIR